MGCQYVGMQVTVYVVVHGVWAVVSNIFVKCLERIYAWIYISPSDSLSGMIANRNVECRQVSVKVLFIEVY